MMVLTEIETFLSTYYSYYIAAFLKPTKTKCSCKPVYVCARTCVYEHVRVCVLCVCVLIYLC